MASPATPKSLVAVEYRDRLLIEISNAGDFGIRTQDLLKRSRSLLSEAYLDELLDEGLVSMEGTTLTLTDAGIEAHCEIGNRLLLKMRSAR